MSYRLAENTRLNNTCLILFAITICVLGLYGLSQDQDADRSSFRFSPKANQFATLESNPDDHPVILMKLLRFKNEDGRALYMKHLKTSRALLRKLGGELVFFGKAKPVRKESEASQELFGLTPNPWDYVTFERYRSRKDVRTFGEKYSAAESSLRDHLEHMVIYALNGTSRLGGKRSAADTVVAPEYPDGDEVYMLNLLRFKPGVGESTYYKDYAAEVVLMIKSRGGKVVYGLMAELPLLSNEEYDQVVLVTYPSVEVFTEMISSETYHRVSPRRAAALEIGHLWGFSNAGGTLDQWDERE